MVYQFIAVKEIIESYFVIMPSASTEVNLILKYFTHRSVIILNGIMYYAPEYYLIYINFIWISS
jgi:hypothetical protein